MLWINCKWKISYLTGSIWEIYGIFLPTGMVDFFMGFHVATYIIYQSHRSYGYQKTPIHELLVLVPPNTSLVPGAEKQGTPRHDLPLSHRQHPDLVNVARGEADPRHHA